MNKIIKKLTAFFGVFVITAISLASSVSAQTGYQPDFEVTAEGAILVNLDSNQVIYEKNPDKRTPPASLSKVMTAILILENVEDIQNTTYTAKASQFEEFEGIPISHADIKAGEVMTVENLLYCLLLQSANEGANVLAEGLSGSNEAFVQKMNEKAKELGANNTHFVDPHGLNGTDQYTTARDMYIILRHAIQNENFRKMISAESYDLPATNKNPARTLTTTVKMIQKQGGAGYYKEYMNGGKTGTLDEAGRCFASYATYDNSDYICVVLKSDYLDGNGNIIEGNSSFDDTMSIYGWAFTNLKVVSAAPVGESIGEVKVKANFSKKHALLTPEKDFFVVIPRESDRSVIKTELHLPDSIVAPVKKGDVIGTAEFFLQDRSLGTVNLVSNEEKDISRNWILYGFELIGRGMKSIWFKIILALFFVCLAFYIFVTVQMNKKGRKKTTVKRSKPIKRKPKR